jgi:hypothetical protein
MAAPLIKSPLLYIVWKTKSTYKTATDNGHSHCSSSVSKASYNIDILNKLAMFINFFDLSAYCSFSTTLVSYMQYLKISITILRI